MTYNTSDDLNDWNSNPPSRLVNLQNVIDNVNPDIIVAVEIGNTNTDVFLNSVLGSSYTKGTFIENTSYSLNSNCLYYKNSEFTNPNFSNTVIESYNADGTTRFRDINRFMITQNGGETIVIYAVHLKPGSVSSSGADRTAEIQYLLDYIYDNAPSTTSENYILLGDFNINRADENAYINLLYYPSSGLNGYFIDPLQTNPPYTGGNWGSAWDWTYTYSSTNLGERYDMILMSSNVWNSGSGIHFNGTYTTVGNPTPTSDETLASDHLPVFATFDFTDNPSPVELVSFTGVLNERQVVLNWKTETEVNNYGFNIERYSSSLGTIWETIGFVEGHGNSNSPKRYNFIDDDINLSGKYYYRLKQIDNDGTFEYSDIVTIEAGIPNNYYLSQNYPNPFNPETRIDYTLPEKQLIAIRVYNTLGAQVAELVNEEREAGSYSVTFDASSVVAGLPSGIYIYRLKTPEYSVNKKMILLK